MIKKAVILILALYSCSILAQSDEPLFYFKNPKDTFCIGVRDATGKVIVPAELKNTMDVKEGEEIKDRLLSFYGCPNNIKREQHACGCVFDRSGKYLYQTFWFDNGADYRVEGYQRIVKNGKMGFANRNGDIVIPAQFDFVSPFNYGYAEFCEGCHWEDTNEEHEIVVGGEWGVINFKGEKVLPSETQQNPNDVKIKDKYYPYPFSYSKKEQEILAFFYKQMPLLASIEYVNLYRKLDDDQKILYFEIVERPSKDFPFYGVCLYDYQKKYGGFLEKTFLVSSDGQQFFHKGYFGEITPFKDWLSKEIRSARAFQEGRTDNPNNLNSR